MTTEPEAIPADVLELARAASWEGTLPKEVCAYEIAHAIMADRASRAPVDGAEAKPVAWWIEANGEGASYFTRDSSLVGARKTSAEFTVTPLYTHPAPASPDAEMVEAARRILPYLEWTIGDESPGYHPTMPSAVAEFKTVLSKHEGDRS